MRQYGIIRLRGLAIVRLIGIVRGRWVRGELILGSRQVRQGLPLWARPQLRL
jgi:hypothetical protein